MHFLGLPPEARFSNKKIFCFLLPVFLEQLMIAGMGIADTFMVSSIGENAVAGVSLVTSVDKFVRQIFVALAAGGSVILSQYIGAENENKAEEALRSCVHVIFAIAVTVTAVMLIFYQPILGFLFGAAEPEVMEASHIYFFCTALSYPLMALYNIGTASYRAMGDSRIPLIASFSMMAVNLGIKYIFIFVMNWGVAGAGLSTALGTGVVGVVLMLLLRRPQTRVHISSFFCFRYDASLVGRIFKISVPNAVENGMFQFGLIVLQGVIATQGTASIAANGIANNVTPLMYALGTAFGMMLMVLVGQCMGAEETEEASFYIRHVLKLDYLCTFINGLLLLAFVPQLISLFNLSTDAAYLSERIMYVYIVAAMSMYPSSFAVAYGLRGAGDTKFVMIVSIASMFVLRIGVAYFLVLVLRQGVLGIWYAQALDWAVRAVVFWGRYYKGKWKKIKVI